MELYLYDGPVLSFGRVIDNRWTAETRAVSEKKALSNFKNQYKRRHNLTVNAKVDLPGEIHCVIE